MPNPDNAETTSPDAFAYASLLNEARRAPEDVSEITDSEGRIVRIERDPSFPGAKRLVLEAMPETAKFRVRWDLPATLHRPAFYPSDIPFLGGIASTIMEGGERIVVVWKDEGCPRVAPEEAERLKSSMPEDVKTMMAAMRELATQGKEVTPEAAATIKEYQYRLTQTDMKEWLEGLSRPEEVDERFSDGFETLVRESEAAGWVPEEEDEAQPMVFRSATFQRDGVRRRLMLTATLGNGLLHLNEEVAPPTPPREDP